VDANQAFGPYLGRWEGDDEFGAYLIAESVEVGPRHVVFRTGRSPPPDGPPLPLARRVADYPFELDEGIGRIAYELPSGLDGLRAILKSATELDYEFMLSNCDGGRGTHKFVLHKRVEAPVDR
jgi:hypothetical protein